MLVTRAMSNSSKNYAFLMCWIWKMGWNLFSSLDIRDNSKVAFLEKIKQSRYMSGNWFRLFRVVNAVKLYHCFGHWLCKKLELRSVGLLLNNQLCWAEICLWKFCCRLHLLPVLLSVVLILLSLLLLLSEAAASRKLCWVNMWYWLPYIKVAQFSF